MATPYSWEEFARDAKYVAQQVRLSTRKFTGIYAIPRGGLVLGVYLSHTLGLPMIMGEYYASQLDPETLVVDDNCMTGETHAPYLARGCGLAVLVLHPLRPQMPDVFYAQSCPDWMIFPWEVDSCAEVGR